MPEQGRWRLVVRSEFSASHCLRHFKGRCESLHGHNFGVEMAVEGSRLQPGVEIVTDFGELKRELAAALEELDHAHLNDTPPFDTLNPSSENLARHIFQRLKPRMESMGVRLISMTVSEKPAQSATYFED